MKPLYIKGAKGMAVNYDEPALAISAPGKTRQLFPLSRVSRIVVTGAVEWSMPALFACADAGVAIVFLLDTGEVRGRWLGCVQQRQSQLQLFSDFWQRADAVDLYRDWFAGMQRMAVRSSARRLGFADWQDADASSLTDWLNTSQTVVSNLNRKISGFLLATVLQFLSDAGLDARCECLHDERVDFAGDLSQLLLWDFYPALSGWSRTSAEPPGHVVLVDFYERRMLRTQQLLRGLLNKLHQRLLELS